jgi:beta-fructofuranosidase
VITSLQGIGRNISPALVAILSVLSLNLFADANEPPPMIQDKTLVAWVKVSDLNQKGGSIMTLGEGQTFDAIVFGEMHDRQWMAGSDNYRRTGPALATEESASPDKIVQMALVHQGRQATLFRDGKELSSWQTDATIPSYGKAAYALFGWRHLDGEGDCYFKGSILDARLYARAFSSAELNDLKPNEVSGEKPVAWWNFKEGPQDKIGRFPQMNLVDKAKVSGGELHLDGMVDYLLCAGEAGAVDTIHFRPAMGTFADPIPFYWKGEYHVFYLQGHAGRVPWRHIVSSDLVHWRQLPTALSSDGAFESWDGGNMFTGSVAESNGRFYCFYTGWNIGNPQGREGIRLAISDDLITWKKQPGFLLVGDGLIYSRAHDSNFRDAFVHKDEKDGRWKMLLCADDAKGNGVAGEYVSDDLLNWKPAPPVGAFQECPDFFRIGDMSYLLGGGFYSSKKDGDEKFSSPAQNVIDSPAVYAGKSMFDGKRHVWMGWLADRAGDKDDGQLVWGGFMCCPRELTAGLNGELYVRPVDEVIKAFNQQAGSFENIRAAFPADQWSAAPTGFENRIPNAKAFFEVEEEGLVELTGSFSRDAIVTLLFHSQQNSEEKAYAFTVDLAASTVTTRGQGVNWVRKGCVLDAEKPLSIQAILGKGTVEVFIDGKYAFSRRVHELSGGEMGIVVQKGNVQLEKYSFKTMSH